MKKLEVKKLESGTKDIFLGYRLSKEGHHQVWVYEGRVVPYKSLGDVGHDVSHDVLRQTLCPVNLHVEPGPGTL